MELKEYAKKILKYEPIAKDNRFSYQYYRLTQDSIVLVVYDYERNEKISFHYPNKQKIKNEKPWENSYPEYLWK
ncbi:hypothetical protein [Enterococcus cecorum]|uniref:hypothetical protein n=1 Tax=Enterococcus cecorum TaxID=44008 RepID=UPI0032C44FE3